MVYLTTTMPGTSARASQLVRILSTINAMESGPQNLSTSSVDPDPIPPDVERPKPRPRAPVSARADPSRVSEPFVGVRPLASSGACFTTGGAGFTALAGCFDGTGTVISGVFAAG